MPKPLPPEPPDPGPWPGDDADEATRGAWLAAVDARYEWRQKRRAALARAQAKLRAEARVGLPHPNWQNRSPLCAVQVPVPADRYRSDPRKPRRVEHRSVWENWHVRCGARCAGYDVTDRRVVGYLYGACARHLLDAVSADRSRLWLLADGRPLPEDPVSLERELVVLALGD